MTNSNCGKTDHCCVFTGVICQFLLDSNETLPQETLDQIAFEDREGHRFHCSKRLDLGSWEAVALDPEWQEKILPECVARGMVGCNDFPRPFEACYSCVHNVT